MFKFFKRKTNAQIEFNQEVIDAITKITAFNKEVTEFLKQVHSRLELIERVTYGKQHGSEDNS